MKALILKLLAQWLGVLALLLFTLGCHTYIPPPLGPSPAVVLPDPTPTPAPPPITTTELNVNLTIGPNSPTAGTDAAFVAVVASPTTTPVTYAWTFGDGATRTTSVDTTFYRFTKSGDFRAAVRVTDAAGLTGSSTVDFTVKPKPPPPPPPPTPLPSYTVTLSASLSSLVVNDRATLTATAVAVNDAPAPTSYAWDCANDGTTDMTTAGNTFICTYPTAGPITSKVTVTGGTAAGAGTTTVTVAAAAPLFVNLTADDSTPAIDQDVIFTATVTSTGRAIPTALQWSWDFDHTATSPYTRTDAGASPHSTTFDGYGSVGVRTVQVLVTDPATGRTAIGTRTVTVGP